MGRVFAIGAAAFGIALAVLIGTRLSEDALGVVLGVVLGAMATIPFCLMLVWALVRRSDPPSTGRREEQHPALPPIINVGTPGGYFAPWQQQEPPAALPAPDSRRQFKEVGAEYEET